MGTNPLSDVAILRRLFFRRFFDNDLVAPNGGGEQKAALVYAALISPGLVVAAGMMVKYMGPFWTPGERLILGLDDTLLCLSISMLVMAIATVVSWDALSLDARDIAVLGPLPLTRRTLVTAKVQALAMFVGSFGLAVNLMPTLLFPPILWGTLQISMPRGLALLAVRALVSMAAACFGFLAVFAARQVLVLVSSGAMFRRLSAVAQPGLLLVFVTAFLLLPALPSATRPARASNGVLPTLGPPGWFLSLHEVLSGRRILDAPGVVNPAGRTRRAPPGAAADRARYLDQMPEFARRATRAVTALAVVALLAIGGYAAESRRLVRRVPPVALNAGWWRRRAEAMARATIVRDPQARATFFFMTRTLVRGSAQRVYLSSGLAVTCACLALVVPKSELGTLLHGSGQPALWSVTIQTLLVAAVVGTVRLVVAVPAELRAAWSFQATWLRGTGPCMAGVRRAAALVAVIPVLALAPLHLLVWDPPTAVVHAIYGVVTAALLVEWLFRDLRSLPFTCATDAGQMRALAARTVMTVLLATVVLGRVEVWGYGTPDHAGMAVAFVGLGAVGAAMRRQRLQRGLQDVVFEEPDAPPTVRLGISSGTE